MTTSYKRLDKDNAAVLLVDHQTGLLSLVRDIDPDRFKNNVLALADLAKYFKLPTILTTSFETGPNGPLVPELKALFPDAPYVARPGQINAWDNEDFVKAIKATGKKQLIIAGVVTEVCVAFPALSALAEGFDVFVVTDASGTFTLARVTPGAGTVTLREAEPKCRSTASVVVASFARCDSPHAAPRSTNAINTTGITPRRMNSRVGPTTRQFGSARKFGSQDGSGHTWASLTNRPPANRRPCRPNLRGQSRPR